MYIEIVKKYDEYDVILGYESDIMPGVGDVIEINDDIYKVDHIQWVDIDDGRGIKLKPLIVVVHSSEYDKNIDYEKRLKHTEEWYACRLKTLKEWARKNNHKEFFDILANGHLLYDPPTYEFQMNVLKHEVEKLKK